MKLTINSIIDQSFFSIKRVKTADHGFLKPKVRSSERNIALFSLLDFLYSLQIKILHSNYEMSFENTMHNID